MDESLEILRVSPLDELKGERDTVTANNDENFESVVDFQTTICNKKNYL